MGIKKLLEELSLSYTHSVLENKKDCIFRCSKKEVNVHINSCHDLPTVYLDWECISYRVHECAVQVDNAMDGSHVMYTWDVSTNFAGEKKRSQISI